ncbi:MAG: hypothetical protein AAGF46_08510, partial [Pseudomonadota bacterium]
TFQAGNGVMVAPGQYTVTMSQRVDGITKALGEEETIEVASIRPEPVLPGSSQAERVIYDQQVDELLRVADGTDYAMGILMEELAAAKAALKRSTAASALYQQAVALADRVAVQSERLSGNETREFYHDWEEMSVAARLWHARFAPGTNAYGPTPAQRESFRIARKQYDEVVAALDAIKTDFDALKGAMDAAGAPWSPGR